MLRTSAAFVLLVLWCSADAFAHFNLNVTLSNGAVNPPAVPTRSNGSPRPPSSGFATAIVDNDTYTGLDFDTFILNIDVTGTQTPDTNDDLIGAAVHASPQVGPETNGPEVWRFFGAAHDNNNPFDLVVTPFAGVGGAVYARWEREEGNGTSLAAQFSNIFTGHAYIQYNTVQFPNGEIRGMIPGVTPGDANLDLKVDITDLGRLATHWQTSGGWTDGDFDASGFIDITDLGLLASNWQSGVQAGAAIAAMGLNWSIVPEPGWTALACAMSLLSRRRAHAAC